MLSLLVWIFAAAAATVEIHTTQPVDLHLDGRAAARAFGPATVTLPDVSTGQHRLTVYRAGDATDVPLDLSAGARLVLYVSAAGVTTDGTAPPPRPDGPPPTVSLRATDGARFQVRVDGGPAFVLDPAQPLLLAGLPPGSHDLEVAREDGLVIWVRGRLLLLPGDALDVQVAEGRMIEVLGRPGAWQPGS